MREPRRRASAASAWKEAVVPWLVEPSDKATHQAKEKESAERANPL